MSAPPKKITLKSSDGEAFEVEEAVAVESQTIKHMIKDDCADSGIPLPNVTSKIPAKVIEYCKKHVEAASSEEKPNDENLKAGDADFVKVDQATLFDLILVMGSKTKIYIVLEFVAGGELFDKIEIKKTKHPQLLYEAKLYNFLQGETGIPSMKWCGTDGDNNVLVIDLLGPSLEDLFVYWGGSSH